MMQNSENRNTKSIITFLNPSVAASKDIKIAMVAERVQEKCFRSLG